MTEAIGNGSESEIVFLDLSMGCSGDMLSGALLGLLDDPEDALDALNECGLEDVSYRLERRRESGIEAIRLRVFVAGQEEGQNADDDHHRPHHDLHDGHHRHDENNHEHHHDASHLDSIRARIGALDLPEQARARAIEVYELIAKAEAAVHGTEPSQVHFHEVGDLDAIADVVAASFIVGRLAPKRMVASPVNVGSGTVKCAHGTLPVPAPATAMLLEGIPAYGSDVAAELCTPTGAAILRAFVDDFSHMPLMVVDRTSCSVGSRRLDRPNILRALSGHEFEQLSPLSQASSENAQGDHEDMVASLSCNIDDMTGEALAHACEAIMEAGALDAFLVPAIMKKGRPASILKVLCRMEDAERMADEIFKNTTTIGIRQGAIRRFVLDRSMDSMDTPYGNVRKKVASGFGVHREKLEYDDVARIAKERGISLEEAMRAIEGCQ